MTFQHPDIAMNTIWRETEEEQERNVFAILDAAVEPGIYDDVLRSEFKQRCLYSGEIPEALARVAPYLVQLERDDPATRLLIRNCWGKSWGIFFTSTAYLEGLHRHFRRFLKVRDEDGNSLYFRYYDPRVLRVYLPTCDRSELLFIFGPVRSFFVEDEDPDSLLEFVVKDEKFITYRRPVVPPPVEEQEVVDEDQHDQPGQSDHELMDMPLGDGEATLVQPPVDLPPVDLPPVELPPPTVKPVDQAVARRAAQLADLPIGGGEETLVSPLEELIAPAEQPPLDKRQALMDMPLGNGLGEETLLMPTDDLFNGSPGSEGGGDPEDPESK